MNMFDFFCDRVVPLAVLLLAVWLVCVIASAALTKAECLEKGYPKSTINWKFEGYCLNLDGAVTGKVDKLGGD